MPKKLNVLDCAGFDAAVSYTFDDANSSHLAHYDVGAYWRGQQLVTAATATSPGAASGQKTWTWTLPPNFPPGHFLRVSSAGGTLRQGSLTLDRRDGDYYEVSLDAGALTWSP